ncbi:MAG: glucose-6-phosphate isomerase [Pseudanabaenaceae cyanobacterium]
MANAIALWQRYQEWLYYQPELGIYVDVSRMGFDEEFVQNMSQQFTRAFADMRLLEAGAIANPDEQRMVGHYWLRAPELAPNADIQHEITYTCDRVETFAHYVKIGTIHPPTRPKFTHVLSVGIGGSALGPQFIAQCFARVSAPLEILFIDNTDPDGMDLVLDQLGENLASTLVIITSKSGGTPETANGMKELEYVFQQRGLDFSKQAVAITGKNSQLEQYAHRQGWIATFPMQDWIGGRTSLMSAVGLLPAALQGIDIRGLLNGAKIMDEATRVPAVKNNPAALLAMSWYWAGEGKGKKDMVILPYKDRLLLFSRYLQQLVMESLGKERDLNGQIVHQGIAVYGNKGSTDQHAYVQQLREGIPNFFATFIEVLKDSDRPHPEVEAGITSGDYLSGFLQGTRQALYENGRESITITIPEVSPPAVGALIALYERAVSFYASLVNINAYHQPGVEAGKKAAAVVLKLQNQVLETLSKQNNPITLAELVRIMGQTEAIETVYKIVRHLSANQRLQVTGTVEHLEGLLISLP